jgi:ElaB/YqjD/DUF883 family membrane-anchored ribosome-binding protein
MAVPNAPPPTMPMAAMAGILGRRRGQLLIKIKSVGHMPGIVNQPWTQRRAIMDVSSDKLMKDLKAVVNDAEDLIKITAGQGGEQIARIRARAEESVRVARARMKDLGGDLDEQVRENPWTAVGIAAGVGLVLGVLLARK